MTNPTHDDGDHARDLVAGDVYAVELVARDLGGRLRRTGYWLWTTVSGLTESIVSAPRTVEIVVREREAGTEMLRTAVDADSSVQLYEHIQQRLLTESAEAFRRSWGLGADI